MLEALISLRMNGETEICRSGDVLCVKLAGAAWGRSERREQMVVQWEDEALEARLWARSAMGERNASIVLPYARREGGRLAVRSTRRVDIKQLPDLDSLLDGTVEHPIVPREQVVEVS